MIKELFSSWPSFSEEEINSVQEVLRSNNTNYWTGGHCKEFEKEFAHFIGTEYAVSLANGTLALEVALRALDIKEGDEVIVTSRTFLASCSCIVSLKATPVFADVDLNSQNITAASIEKVLTAKTKAVIVVHLAGNPAEMDEINALARQHNLSIIEDCAQAHGASYKDKKLGSWGDIAAWSFCQDKIMSTGGEGGMVTTNNKDLWQKMWAYKDHGKSYDAVFNKKHAPGFRWLHESFGSNYRMTEMQAAIGRIQLSKLPEWKSRRRENALSIEEVAKEFNVVRATNYHDYETPAFYKYYLFIEEKYLANGWSRDRILNEINQLGVPCFQGSCSEVYLEKAFDNTPWRPKTRLPNAKKLGQTSLMFLVHPTLTPAEIQKTCDALEQVLTRAQR